MLHLVVITKGLTVNPIHSSNALEFDVFISGLDLIFGITALLFTLAIFLIQITSQEYSPRISRVIYSDKYFVSPFIFFILIATFNLTVVHFKLGFFPYTTLSYTLSLAVMGFIASTLLITGHFLDSSNLIQFAGLEIQRKIKRRKRFLNFSPFVRKPLACHPDFIRDLNKEIDPLVSTCIKAIEKKDVDIVESSLKTLCEITKCYLIETQDILCGQVNDEFLSNMNDQFSFIY